MDKTFLYRFLSGCFRAFPLRKRTILFVSYYGAQYGCNPKYLSECFARKYPAWTMVWGFTDPKAHSAVPARKVRYLSLRFLFELATCKVFVTNFRMPLFFKRRAGQFYVQTWHSSLRLKAIEADAEATIPPAYVQMAKHDSLQISLLLSGCKISTDIFRRAFWYDGEVLPSGTPRMDLLFSENPEKRRRLKQKLGLPESINIALYAPTFRENKTGNPYNLDLAVLLNGLQARWGGEWIILLRLHPHMRNDSPILVPSSVPILDVSTYDDIQELLYVSDVVISDYSSLIFDFALTGRPCFLYTPDLDDYLEKERRLYFDPKDLPFPLIRNNEELTTVLKGFNENDYRSHLEDFLQRIGSYETGNACELVCQAIMNRIT